MWRGVKGMENIFCKASCDIVDGLGRDLALERRKYAADSERERLRAGELKSGYLRGVHIGRSEAYAEMFRYCKMLGTQISLLQGGHGVK